MIAVSDPVKESSAAAIGELRAMGLDVVLLTGDNRRTAQAVAARIGGVEVHAEVMPQEKELHVRALMDAGKRVAMVGDGINDAPALARADVGVAIGAGTDIAIESADVVLVKSDLRDVATLVRLSRAVIRNIKENLFWALIYNTLGIPLAAGVFYLALDWKLNPMFAAAAMSCPLAMPRFTCPGCWSATPPPGSTSRHTSCCAVFLSNLIFDCLTRVL